MTCSQTNHSLLLSELVSAVNGVSEAITKAAEDPDVNALEDKIEELQKQLADTSQANDALNKQLSATNQSFSQQLAAANASNNSLSQQLESAQAKLVDYADLQERIEELSQSLKKAESKLDAANNRILNPKSKANYFKS